MIKKQLIGHDSEETAYIVKDYPWGFRMRTEQKVWIETTKYGQRSIIRTKDPRTGLWCKPKLSTYSEVLAIGLNEIGYIEYWSLTLYAKEETIDEFTAKFQLSDYQKKRLGIIRRINKTFA